MPDSTGLARGSRRAKTIEVVAAVKGGVTQRKDFTRTFIAERKRPMDVASRFAKALPGRLIFPALVLWSVVAVSLAYPTTAAAERLPAEAFAQNGNLTAPALSPNGNFIAGFVHHEGQNVVIVWNLASGERKGIARLDSSKRYLHRILWANEDRLLVVTSQPNHRTFGAGWRGRTSWLVGVDREGGNQKIYAHKWRRFGGGETSRDSRVGKSLPLVRSGADVLSMLDDDSDGILLQIDSLSSGGSAAYRMDTKSGRLARVQKTEPGIIRWFADHDGVVRMGYGAESRQGSRWLIARANAESEFREVARWDVLAGEAPLFPLGFSFDGRTAYMAAPSGKGTRGVFEFDLEAGKMGKLLFAHDQYDVAGLRFDRGRRILEGVRWIGDTQEIHFLDNAAAQEHAALQQAVGKGTLWLADESRDTSKKLYMLESGDLAPRYFLYHRKERRLEPLYLLLPQITNATTASVKKISYAARDGYEVSGYLTLPVGRNPKNLPTVVYPHGGPWSRDFDTFDRMAQFLANAGFAVFQMNFRGSTGLGSAHATSGYRQLGERIQNDITDGVKWIIQQGIADPNRIAIYGASHGGYAALMGLARDPELYRCGAALAPVTDLYAFVDSARWANYTAEHRVLWGDLSQPGEAERLRKNSPVNLAAEIQDPVFLAHGRHDLVVPYRHTDRMAAALRTAGREPEVVFYEDWHGFIHQPNRIDFFKRLERFLAACTRKLQP